jgi:hypothetical protein
VHGYRYRTIIVTCFSSRLSLFKTSAYYHGLFTHARLPLVFTLTLIPFRMPNLCHTCQLHHNHKEKSTSVSILSLRVQLWPNRFVRSTKMPEKISSHFVDSHLAKNMSNICIHTGCAAAASQFNRNIKNK